MQSRTLILLVAPLLLPGCLSQSDIQSKYMRSQNECRDITARSVTGGETAQPVANDTPSNSSLAARFAECMNKAGWHLATPKPTVVTQVPNPPTGSPSTNPHAALSTAAPTTTAAAQPVANPPSGSPSVAPIASAARTAPVANPPSGAPSVNPSAAAAKVATPVQAATQPTTLGLPASNPAPAATVYTPAYGAGPGRQF